MHDVIFFRSENTRQSSQIKWPWIVAGLILVVIVLEFLTPAPFIFGYLYTGPILLTSNQLGRKATFQVTTIAVGLTLLNLWLPDASETNAATVANRVIASMALVVTGFLGNRNRYYQEAIAQQQAQLQTQEQLVSLREDFALTLTHDLKTPLLGAIETLYAFQHGKFDPISPTQQQVLSIIVRSHQTSLQLLETLLDVYRNDTEGLMLQLTIVDLATAAEEAASTLFDLALSRQVYLSCHYGASDFSRSLWVKGDALQLQRVFTNLLVNAINHSRRGDRIEVVLESQDSFQLVKVLDTGSGIQPEEFPHLFERFYQGQSDRQAKGTGLGLYLCRQIVEAHGGTIWAENRYPRGAVFGFKLPVAASPPTYSTDNNATTNSADRR
jgi:two-component system NarL family sensor kinase